MIFAYLASPCPSQSLSFARIVFVVTPYPKFACIPAGLTVLCESQYRLHTCCANVNIHPNVLCGAARSVRISAYSQRRHRQNILCFARYRAFCASCEYQDHAAKPCNAALANINYTRTTASRQMMRIPGIAKSVTVCANLGIRSLISCESQLMPHRSKHANSSPSSANVRPCVRMSEYSVAQCSTCATSNTYCQQVCDCQRPFAGIPHSF